MLKRAFLWQSAGNPTHFAWHLYFYHTWNVPVVHLLTCFSLICIYIYSYIHVDNTVWHVTKYFTSFNWLLDLLPTIQQRYSTMHHFVTEMCPQFMLQNGTLWYMELVLYGICTAVQFTNIHLKYAHTRYGHCQCHEGLACFMLRKCRNS